MFVYIPKVNCVTFEETYVTSSSDGYLIHLDATNYTLVWVAENATSAIIDGIGSSVGQFHNSSLGYYIHRAFVYFDTSSIPDNDTIDIAILKLYCYQDNSGVDFNIIIQNGQPDYPNDPLTVASYDKTFYSGTGGTLSTSDIILHSWNEIPLSQTAFSWINKTGTTKLCLRSSREINGATPSNDIYEHIVFRAYEWGTSQLAPRLFVQSTTEDDPPASSGGDSGNGEPTSLIDIPEITVPKIPIWGYYLILGSVCVVALASIFTKQPKSKHGPNGTKIKRTHKRLPKRNKRGRFNK